MKLFYRILLAVYAFCLTIVSLIIMLITFNRAVFDNISYYISDVILQNYTARFTLFIFALLFLFLNLFYLASGLSDDKDKKAISRSTNIGEIRISLNTIENIAHAASRKLTGVRETKATVIRFDDSVSISVRVVVLPDINIPALSEDLQVKVKNSVEETSGVRVSDVKVYVDNIHTGTGYKSRVE